MAGTCSNPSCTAEGSKRCGACKQASYCSSACQKQDWKHHKSACKASTQSSTKVLPKECSNLGCAARPDQLTIPCYRCDRATYCSPLCEKEDWEDHKPNCRDSNFAFANDTSIETVMIHSNADRGVRYSKVLTPRKDTIFKTCPVRISQQIGFPLLVQRPSDKSARGPPGDNQHATWLMIDPYTGFAPAEWQGGVGNVIVARADGRPLDTATLGAITDYISNSILTAFGNGYREVRKYYNRDRLDKYIANHLKMQQEFKSFQGMSFVDENGKKVQL